MIQVYLKKNQFSHFCVAIMADFSEISKDDNKLSSLLLACQAGNLAVVKSLLKGQEHLLNKMHRRTFPLWIAASENNKALMEVLIASGADLNLVTEEGTPAIYIAAERYNLDALELLVKAEHRLITQPNTMPLHYGFLAKEAIYGM